MKLETDKLVNFSQLKINLMQVNKCGFNTICYSVYAVRGLNTSIILSFKVLGAVYSQSEFKILSNIHSHCGIKINSIFIF